MKLKKRFLVGFVFVFFLVSCLDESGTSKAGTGSSYQSEVENLGGLDYPLILRPGESGEITLNVNGVPGEALYYSFTKSDSSSKIVPSTGIIIISEQNRQIFSSITAGNEQGLKTYTLKLSDSTGKETIQKFDISVQN